MQTGLTALRRATLSKPLIGLFRRSLPHLSDTEQQALDAGDTWWEANLFSGHPDWKAFGGFHSSPLTPEEQAFIDGPVENFCAMIDDWSIEFEHRDLPPEAWQFLKDNRFFGMIIPREHGGLGFSARAHSDVVKRIASRNVSAAVTVMVPNSLGPGELLMLYGTKEQRAYYLPRLASGEEIPCFALTGVEAGSDASSMTARGVVCEGEWKGEKTLGINLNWEKRYTTLGPIATVIGLAFKLEDPEGRLGGNCDLGITVALVPTDLSGVEIGERHLPDLLAFQNGPSEGRDVFIPLDQVIGGRGQIGEGWKMLMGALAAGRGISLPSLSTAAAQVSAFSSGAYARIREQFGVPVGQFEGVREKLAPIAGTAYLLEAARRFITIGIDAGHHPAVASGIMKHAATERMRETVNDAMDVHGGKAICTGPRNYLETAYRAIPVGITVEGANILTRSLIIFGQGAIRCHPYLLKEMAAVRDSDAKAGLRAFDKLFWAHVGHDIANAWRSFWHGLTGGLFAQAPKGTVVASHYRQLSRWSAALAIASEISLGVLGGKLKFKESLSARLGDVLAELFLLSAVLKRFEADGSPEADRPLLDWSFVTGLARIETRLVEVADNFPNAFFGGLIRFLTLPTGRSRKAPSDRMMNEVAELIQDSNDSRVRLTEGVYIGNRNQPLAQLENAFHKILAVAPLRELMKREKLESYQDGLDAGLLSETDIQRLKDSDNAVRTVIEVDSFSPDYLAAARHGASEPKSVQPPQARRA